MPRLLRLVVALMLPVLAALALLAAFQLINDDGSDRVVAEQQLVRWGNVTLLVPAQPTVAVSRDFWEGSPAVLLSSTGNEGGGIAIDAETGTILADTLKPADRKAADDLLASLDVSTVDEKLAPWPYEGSDSPASALDLGQASFPFPDPASGFTAYEQRGIGGEHSMLFVITNGRSHLAIDIPTHEIVSQEVAAGDEKVMARVSSELPAAAIE